MTKLSPFVPIAGEDSVPFYWRFLSTLQNLCNCKGQVARVIAVKENALGKTSLVELRYVPPTSSRRAIRIMAYQVTSFFMLLLFRKNCSQRTTLHTRALFLPMTPLLIPAVTALYRRFEGTPIVVSTVVEGPVIKQIVGEWSTNLQIQLPDGKMILWKQDGNERENISEVSASPLAAYLTGGAVPIASMGRRKDEENVYQEGTLQPFLELNSDPFTALLNGDSFNFEFLNDKQIHQLFCHVIADCIIFNFDTHQGQYALNKNGDVISLDKGQAFALFNLNTDRVDYLNLAEDRHLTDRVVSRKKNDKKLYVRVSSTFVKEMQSNRRLSPANSILQGFFERCENIPQVMVEECLLPFAEKFYPQQAKPFILFMWERIRFIKPTVYKYFNWRIS